MMNQNTPSPLAELRDIHLPMQSPWWDLAVGWWFLFLLVVLCAVLAWFFLPKLLKKKHLKQRRKETHAAILDTLQKRREKYAENADAHVLLVSLSSFLRRVTLTLFAKENVAGKTDKDWLNFLDSHWAEAKPSVSFESEPIAQLLKHGAYRQTLTEAEVKDVESLLDLTEKWLKVVLKYHV